MEKQIVLLDHGGSLWISIRESRWELTQATVRRFLFSALMRLDERSVLNFQYPTTLVEGQKTLNQNIETIFSFA